MHINYSWNFHQNIFTLTISFIVLNAAIEFDLIYRPYPVEYSEQLRGTTAELRERKSLQYEIPITKRHLRKHPILFGREEIFFLPMVITIRGCIQRKTWCMDPYAGVDYNSPYLTVNSIVSYSPPLQRERGGVGKISPIGFKNICIWSANSQNNK